MGKIRDSGFDNGTANRFLFRICFLLPLAVAACQHLKPSDSNPPARAEEYAWLKELDQTGGIRGVVLRPWPEVPGSEKWYSEAYPHEVNIVFDSGKIRVVGRDADGRVVEDRWSNLRELPFADEDVVSLEEWRTRARQTNRP